MRTEVNYEQAQAPAEVPLWREAFAFCVANAGVIVKVLLPPSIIAYLSALAFEQQIATVRRDLLLGRGSVLMTGGWWAYERLSMPLQLLITLKQWFLWVCYCFALIGICKLVSDLNNAEPKSGESVFAAIRDRPFRFLQVVTLFFVVLMLAFAVVMFINFGMVELQFRAHFRWNPYLGALLPILLVSAVIVRWAFAVPLAVLRDLPFGVAMRASDRLTDNRTLPIWSLLIESEISGYLALIVPSWILFYLHAPQKQFTYYASLAASILLSAMTQAPLMIGLGLVLSKNREDDGMGGAGDRRDVIPQNQLQLHHPPGEIPSASATNAEYHSGFPVT